MSTHIGSLQKRVGVRTRCALKGPQQWRAPARAGQGVTRDARAEEAQAQEFQVLGSQLPCARPLRQTTATEETLEGLAQASGDQA